MVNGFKKTERIILNHIASIHRRLEGESVLSVV